jgi:hypothetical protein
MDTRKTENNVISAWYATDSSLCSMMEVGQNTAPAGVYRGKSTQQIIANRSPTNECGQHPAKSRPEASNGIQLGKKVPNPTRPSVD